MYSIAVCNLNFLISFQSDIKAKPKPNATNYYSRDDFKLRTVKDTPLSKLHNRAKS